jgi:hypothetical protein
MYLDVRVRLSNKFRARPLMDTVAMWLSRDPVSNICT